jgi:hypothetical protein
MTHCKKIKIPALAVTRVMQPFGVNVIRPFFESSNPQAAPP